MNPEGEGYKPMSHNPGRPREPGKRRLGPVLMVLLGLALVLAAADLLTPKPGGPAVEEVPLISALLGLAGGLALALLARGLRRLIRREEGYYAD